MAFSFSPRVVQGGLVLYLDVANTKSYISGSTTITDLTSNFSVGTLLNGPTYNSANGGSIVLDNTDDCITGSVIFSSFFSVDFWIMPTALANFTQVFRVGFNNVGGDWGDFVFHSTSDGSIYCGTTTNSRFTPSDSGCGPGSIVINTPICISYTFSPGVGTGTANLYKNSRLLGTKILTNPANPSINSMYEIGRPAANASAMRLYSFKVYNRTLSPTEVLQNYNATKSRFNLT